jgi:hypothetical protein
VEQIRDTVLSGRLKPGDRVALGFDNEGFLPGAYAGRPGAASSHHLGGNALDPAVLTKGMLFRQVGSGDLYMLVPREEKGAKTASEDSG